MLQMLGDQEGVGEGGWAAAMKGGQARAVWQTGERMLTKGQDVSTVNLPSVKGFAVSVDQLLHLQVLSLNRYPWRLQTHPTA